MNCPRLPPSPQAVHARKPLVNITILHNNSTSLPKHRETIKNLNHSQSTHGCQTKEKQKGESNKVRELRQRKNSLMSRSSSKISTHCIKHPQSKATHRLAHGDIKYCHQCALLQSKQCEKMITLVQEQSQPNSKHIIEQQMKHYLQKCRDTMDQLRKQKDILNDKIAITMQDYSNKIKSQETNMENDIKRVVDVHTAHINLLKRRKSETHEEFQQFESQVDKIQTKISKAKLDIETTMEAIRKNISLTEFKTVMSEYWKLIDKANDFVEAGSKMADSFKQQAERTLTVFGSRSKEQSTIEFTFSKNDSYGTPLISKRLQGIKYTQSHQGSQENSSMKSSIVDSKINFINDTAVQ